MYANHPEMAKRWESVTPRGKLPQKVAASQPEQTRFDVDHLCKLCAKNPVVVLDISQIQDVLPTRDHTRTARADVSKPILVDENYRLLDGRHRIKKLRKMGKMQVQARVATAMQIVNAISAVCERTYRPHAGVRDDAREPAGEVAATIPPYDGSGRWPPYAPGPWSCGWLAKRMGIAPDLLRVDWSEEVGPEQPSRPSACVVDLSVRASAVSPWLPIDLHAWEALAASGVPMSSWTTRIVAAHAPLVVAPSSPGRAS